MVGFSREIELIGCTHKEIYYKEWAHVTKSQDQQSHTGDPGNGIVPVQGWRPKK